MGKINVKILGVDEDIPLRERVSAVFLIAFENGKILSARNERGWDIPGGHLEGQESMMEGLRRESEEEAGVDFENAVPFAVLIPDWTDKVMLFYVTGHFNLGEFVPKEDALERDILEVEDLLERYHGDKDMLRSLIEAAKERR